MANKPDWVDSMEEEDCTKLKAQLAAKDAEIEKLRNIIDALPKRSTAAKIARSALNDEEGK